jgi:hypothetical protein
MNLEVPYEANFLIFGSQMTFLHIIGWLKK